MATPSEREDEIAQLPHGASLTHSFRVFASWLRENREGLERQISGLAVRFEEIDRENKRRLDEIHDETRRTNGRVTALEKTTEIAVALEHGQDQWESDAQATARRQEEERRRAREKITDRLTSVGLVMLGLIGGGLLQHLGI